MLIAFEGLDASGKTTQIQILQRHVTRAKVIKFPLVGTPTEQLIRHLFNHPNTELGPVQNGLILQTLFLADKAEVQSGLHQASQDPKAFIIFDRYINSDYAYGAADGLDTNWLTAIHSQFVQPDFNILLDIPAAESFRRRPKRTDLYEADAERMALVREKYLEVFQSQAWGTVGGATWAILDGTQPADVLHRQIIGLLSGTIDLRPPANDRYAPDECH